MSATAPASEASPAAVQVSVVIPIFNEEENVVPLGQQLRAALDKLGRDYEVLLVDDGSRDGTWERLLALRDQWDRVRLIRFRRNFGQTAAMSAGFREARGDIVVTLDADLQNDPADIGMLLSKADEGFDVVSGWRKNRKDTFINRRLPSMLANNLIGWITGVPLHDYGCTLKAYRREIVKSLRLYGEMHRFIPALASWVGAEVAEVVVNHRARQFGASKYGISRTFRVILDLMTVKFLLRYSAHPIQMFGKIGLFFGVPGALMALAALAAHVGYNVFGLAGLADAVDFFKRPAWIIMPFMLILFCTQFITMGLLAEIQIRTYHEAQDKPTYVVRDILDVRRKA